MALRPAESIHILVMTATITPKPDVRSLGRKDPALRRRDYEDAFQFYGNLVGKCLDRIVFVENSLSDLSSIEQIADRLGIADKVEFVSFAGLDYPQLYGRGYGELFLLDHAMRESQTIKEFGDTAIIWKITGRYIVSNMTQLIARRPKAFDFYCNMRNLPKRVVDMYLMAWTPRGYQDYLQGRCSIYEVSAAAALPEKALREELDRAPRRSKFVSRFRIVPRVSGIRGLDNKGYSTDNLWKFYIRAAVHRACPPLWI